MHVFITQDQNCAHLLTALETKIICNLKVIDFFWLAVRFGECQGVVWFLRHFLDFLVSERTFFLFLLKKEFNTWCMIHNNTHNMHFSNKCMVEHKTLPCLFDGYENLKWSWNFCCFKYIVLCDLCWLCRFSKAILNIYSMVTFKSLRKSFYENSKANSKI